MMHYAIIKMDRIYISFSKSRRFSLAKFTGSRKGNTVATNNPGLKVECFVWKNKVITKVEYHEFLAINNLYDIIELKSL